MSHAAPSVEMMTIRPMFCTLEKRAGCTLLQGPCRPVREHMQRALRR
jgi:hypothetical protein